MLVLLMVCVVAGAAALYRTRLARAERAAEYEWLSEEQAWWAALRNTTP